MYSGAISFSSGKFYSLQYETLTYFGGWYGVERSISDRMSYRNATTHAFNFIFSSMNFNVFGRLVGDGEMNKRKVVLQKPLHV